MSTVWNSKIPHRSGRGQMIPIVILLVPMGAPMDPRTSASQRGAHSEREFDSTRIRQRRVEWVYLLPLETKPNIEKVRKK